MSESFEGRLTAASSKEVFRKAKNILKAGELLCCLESSPGVLRAVFRDQHKGRVERVEVSGFPNGPFKSVCTCPSSVATGICEHAVGACLYHAEFTIKNAGADLFQKDSPAKYAGLKYEGLPELLTQGLVEHKGEVVIIAESEFPHVPSKWERALITATLVCGRREYAGNLSNLRQLHFGKNLAASLQITDFPMQDRQIIRYLAINAQPEGSKLALDAEQTAEFFHCLINFPRFMKQGERVVVHGERAEPMLLCGQSPQPGIFTLKTAVRVNGVPLPLKDVKVITGRAGCWLGINGEYWFIPATVDVSWLRNFLRTTEQHCDAKSADILLGEDCRLPIKVINSDAKRIGTKKFVTHYLGRVSPTGELQLELEFDYDGKVLPPDRSRLGISDASFWERDAHAEKEVMDSLIRFGFEEQTSNGGKLIYVLKDPEAAGAFADEFIPALIKAGSNVLLSSELVTSCGYQGLPEIKLHCKIYKEHPQHFDLEYKFRAGKQDILTHWKEMLKFVKQNSSYICCNGQGPFKLPKELSVFMDSVSDIVQTVGDKPEVLRVPRFSAAYWANIGHKLPDSVPPEFHAMKKYMESVEMQSGSEKPFAEDEQLILHEFKGELRNYQKQAVAWMRELSIRGFNLILADEMGLGKTIQTLAMMASNHKNALPALILCPTTLIENWGREARKFVPSLKVLIVSGPDRKPIWEKALDHDIIISSYSLIKRDFEHICSFKFNFLILDEAQHIKNPFTANAQTCKSIHSAHRLVLTGTPLENSPEDLWSIFDFLHPGMLGSYNAFKHHYAEIYKYKDKQDDLAARISPFVMRRKKADVYAELPPKQEQVLYCEMDNGQRKLYDEFLIKGREECEKILKTKKSAGFEILAALLRLRQICCHPALLPEKLLGEIQPRSAKTELLQELLLETLDSGHKVLIFSQFTSLLKQIRTWLESQNIAYEYLDGATKDRIERVDRFNNTPEIPIFLLSLKAGGTGLNLTSADTVIIYDPWWNPAVEAQATDRTHRIGQTKPVTSIKLVVKNSIEEKILELQKKKDHIFKNLVDNPAAALRQLKLEDLEFLLK